MIKKRRGCIGSNGKKENQSLFCLQGSRSRVVRSKVVLPHFVFFRRRTLWPEKRDFGKKITNSGKTNKHNKSTSMQRGECKKISRKLLIVGLQLVLALDGSLGPGNFSAGLSG